MDIDGNFRRVGNANVELTRQLVEILSEESWYQNAGDTHEATKGEGSQVIYLVHDEQLRHDQPLRQPALEVFSKSIRPVLAVTANCFDGSRDGRELTEQHGMGYFVRARLLRVMNGATFNAAGDTSFSQTHAHRVHVPIVTTSDVDCTVGDETLNIPAGEIYEINNCRARSIQNRGANPCVHLVLEYVLKGEAPPHDSGVNG